MLYSFFNLSHKHSNKVFYAVISFFTSFIFIKNPPLLDSYRYLFFFDMVNYYNSNIDSLNYVNFGILSKIIDYIGLPYYFLPFIVTFTSVFVLLLSFGKVSEKLKINNLYLMIGVVGIIVLANPLLITMVLRFYLAAAFFVFSIFCYLFNEYKKMLIFILLSIFFHFSILYLIPFFFLSMFFSLTKIKTIVMAVLSLVLSKFAFVYIISLLSFIPIFSHFESYVLLDVEKNTNASSVFVVMLSILLNVLMVVLFFTLGVRDKFLIKLKNIIFFVIIAVSLTCNIYEAFNRFFYVLNLLIFIYIICCLNCYLNSLRVVFVKTLLFSIICIKAFIFDFYIYRPAVIHGDPIALAVKSPLFIFLYSDKDYRKVLSQIDKDGYLIE